MGNIGSYDHGPAGVEPGGAGSPESSAGISGEVSIARVYDYWLGGKDNRTADRAAGNKLLKIYPDAARLARANRAFLARAVRCVAGHRVAQFIDIGSGLPTSPNVHEVARSVIPGAHVVYVDHDPLVLVYARALLEDQANGIAVVAGDMREPGLILADPELCRLIDFTEPVCVLLVSVLHFVSADMARVIVDAFAERMRPGSFLVISVGTARDPELAKRFTEAYSAGALYTHAPEDVASWFDGFELLEPGLVDAAEWRSLRTLRRGQSIGAATVLAGVGRKVDGPA